MRNRALIACCLLLTAAMLLPLAACSTEQEEPAIQLTILTLRETENGAMEYSAAEIPFTGEAEYTKLIGMRDEKLYFTVAASPNEETDIFKELGFIRTDMDGGNITQLQFNVGDWFKLYDDHGGAKFVPHDVTLDYAGNLFAVAHEMEGEIILPDATAYRLNASGDIEQTIDLGNADCVDTANAKFDTMGNMYFRRLGRTLGIVTIVEPDGYTYDLIDENESFGVVERMSDGRVAFVILPINDSTSEATVRIIDAEKRDWGDSLVLELRHGDSDVPLINSCDGIGRYDLCFADIINFNGYDMETGDIDVLFNWEEIGISADSLLSSILIDGNNIAFTHYVSR